MKPKVNNYRFWVNEHRKRMFQVIDIPMDEKDDVVLREVKFYGPEEQGTVKHIPYCDWLLYTDPEAIPENMKNELLKECVPSVTTYMLIKR